jgi:hypothetical protein
MMLARHPLSDGAFDPARHKLMSRASTIFAVELKETPPGCKRRVVITGKESGK